MTPVEAEQPAADAAGRGSAAVTPPVSPPVSPSVEDPVVRLLSEVVGGPVGRHSAAGSPPGPGGSRLAVPAVTVLVAAGTAVMLVAVLLRQHCRATLWASPGQFTHACYSDLPALRTAAGLGQGLVPYLDAVGGVHLAQPVGTGALLWLLGAVAPGGDQQLRWFFDACVLLIVVALAVTVSCVARLAGHRRWDAALVALSPVLLTSSLISLDLVAVALTCAALLASARSRVLTAGVLLGLAVCVRPLALVLLVAIGLLALRSGKGSAWWRTTAAALGTWLLVNVPVLLLSWDGWTAYWRALRQGTVGYGSLLLLPELASSALTGGGTPADPPGWLALTGVVLVAAVAAALLLLPDATRRRYLPRVSPAVVAAALGVAVIPALVVLLGADALTTLSRGTVSDVAGRWIWVALSAVVVLGIGLFTLAAPRRPRLPVVVLLLLVGLLLVSPSTPVQAAVWVLPFAALAVPSWGTLLAWAGVEAVYATGTWLYVYWLSVPDRGLPPWAYALLLVARVAAWVWLAGRAVQLSLHPEDDPVRAVGPLDHGSPDLGSPDRDSPDHDSLAHDSLAHDVLDPDDPTAGPVRHAPDVLVVAFR